MTAKEMSVDALLSELDGTFCIKEEQRTAVKTSLVGKAALFFVPTVFGKSLVKHCGAMQLTTGW